MARSMNYDQQVEDEHDAEKIETELLKKKRKQRE
jgi:hypothetical protein